MIQDGEPKPVDMVVEPVNDGKEGRGEGGEMWTLQDLKKTQKEDPDIGPIIQLMGEIERNVHGLE